MKKKIIQQSIAIVVIVFIAILAIQPLKPGLAGALLIGAAIAFAIIEEIYTHTKKGRHDKARKTFWKAYIILGVLLIITGLVVLTTGNIIAVMDVGLGSSMALYGGRKINQ